MEDFSTIKPDEPNGYVSVQEKHPGQFIAYESSISGN